MADCTRSRPTELLLRCPSGHRWALPIGPAVATDCPDCGVPADLVAGAHLSGRVVRPGTREAVR